MYSDASFSGSDGASADERPRVASSEEAEPADEDGFRRRVASAKGRRASVVLHPKRPKVEKWQFTEDEVATVWPEFLAVVTTNCSRFAHLAAVTSACEKPVRAMR